ncbi:MAG: hypothetical protein DDT25_01311 [Chloroflexi bacterium]|nr:hypothetical protein [Chloroflexota bacterium]
MRRDICLLMVGYGNLGGGGLGACRQLADFCESYLLAPVEQVD